MYIAAQGTSTLENRVFSEVNALSDRTVDCSEIIPESQHTDLNPGQQKP